ncbi:MAG: glycoside hydrolase domain-containing protein [Eubacterium sp.]|uniref:glycoside hydrolase domain-containing protein n=1 Tax=Eubacterium sp. TaxID=142586 RepID=UPI0039964643
MVEGRKADGSLNLGNSDNNTGFNPFWWGADYTETNAFNMAVSVPQDGIGLANLYGGRDQLADKLLIQSLQLMEDILDMAPWMVLVVFMNRGKQEK